MAAHTEKDASFTFTPQDLQVLEQAQELDRQLDSKGLIYSDPQVDSYLQSLGIELVGNDPAPEKVTFKFRIVRDPMVNAFSLADGSIYANTGLIAAMHNSAELASVLAHEIAHVTGRHEYLENRNIRKKAVVLDVLSAVNAAGGYAMGASAFGSAISAAAEVSSIATVSTIYGYSQNRERDADSEGYARLVRAGYDGKAMAQALQLLDETLEYEPIEPFWRTHPKLHERIALAEWRGAKQNIPQPRPASEREYLERFAPVIRYNISADLENRRARTAVARAQRLADLSPQNALDQTLLAEGYAALGAKTPQPTGSELTPDGAKANRKRMQKMTEQEEQKALLAAPNGRSVLAANRAKAESLYLGAIGTDPSWPEAHRGLAALYAGEGKAPDAVREYSEYLKLARPDAVDRLQIERRVQQLQKKDAPGK